MAPWARIRLASSSICFFSFIVSGRHWASSRMASLETPFMAKKRPISMLHVLLISLIALLCSNVAESRALISVDDFGAVGDGIANDTQAFLNAWTAACTSREHTILAVPAGKAYQVGPVEFPGPCRAELKLLIFGSIVAPASPDAWAGKDPTKWLYFYRVNELSVSGGGTIDGTGQEWWARSCKRNKTNPCTPAPKAVHFEECRDIHVQGITLLNSQQFHLTFTRCSDVKANYLRVIAPADSPNTDGVHLNDSSNVHIMDDLISTGDDCISMIGNCTDVRIRAVSCGPGHGISIGSLGKAQTTDRIEKVKLDTCFISNTQNGVRIKTWQGGSGFARKLKFESIVMKNVSNPIIIDQYYCDQPTPCANQTRAVRVEKIHFIDIKGTSATQNAIKFACSDTFPCRQLVLQNVNLTLEGGGEASAYCYKASGKSIGSVVPASCLARADFIKQIHSPRMLSDLSDATATYI